MAMNASGIRDTARVLHVSPTTVINELKKKGIVSSPPFFEEIGLTI
jgi:transposase-like protein